MVILWVLHFDDHCFIKLVWWYDTRSKKVY